MKRLIALTICLVFLLCACRPQQMEQPAAFYYQRSDSAFDGSDGIIAPEQRELVGISGDLGAILDFYCAGPVTPGLRNPLPPDARLLAYKLEDGVLMLRFDAAFASLSGIELTLAAGCLARTFLTMTGAQTLVLTAEGSLLNGQTAMRISLSDLELRDSSLDRLHRNLTVYYTDQSQRYLIGQEVSVAPSGQEELYLEVLELLLTPPTSSGLRSALPQGTRFLSASLSDGLCTVDLSAEFESRRPYTQPGQLLSLMSIVNTLTGLPEVEGVEFLIEGNLLIRYGPLTIGEALHRDERWLGPVRTGLGEQDVTLYLSHGPEGRLLGVPVRLGRSTAVSQAALIVEHLLGNPGGNDIRTCIPPQTKLLSLIVGDGLCRVNLSREYLQDPDLLLQSGRVIAASLCTLEEIDQVQILVEGGVPEDYDPNLFGPLSPNEDWFL